MVPESLKEVGGPGRGLLRMLEQAGRGRQPEHCLSLTVDNISRSIVSGPWIQVTHSSTYRTWMQ